MKNCLLVVLFCIAVSACKNKTSVAGEEKVAMNEFIETFTPAKLPYTIIDTAINSVTDTATISYNVFTQFVPDTVLNQPFGKERKLTFRPLARFGKKKEETYLAMLVQSKSRSAVYLLVFTKKNVFSASMPVLISGNDDGLRSVTVDARLTISLQKEWVDDNEMLFSRTIYAYNSGGIFSVVMTETNDQSGVANNINNPLDTLPGKNKYSGDYVKTKKNFLTIRDGKTPESYLFFVHFENDDEDACNGEVKGEFFMKTPTTGVFTESGDPCVIDFNFQSNKVKVKEQGSCGSHRGIKCFFNDTYTKKKDQKTDKKEPAVKRKS